MTAEQKQQVLKLLEDIIDRLDADIWLEMKNVDATNQERLERMDIMDALTMIQTQIVIQLQEVESE